jgi:biopolymer transport protein ExbB/TolQ
VVPFLKKLLNSTDSFLSLFVAGIGCLLVNIVFSLMPDFWSIMFIGKTSVLKGFTFQDVMWCIFFIGLMQIFFRKRDINKIAKYKKRDYLPVDFETIIGAEELTEVIKKSREDSQEKMGILPYMILQISLQFRTNNSISITSDFLSKQLELFLHSVELRYNQLKYIIWLIPSLGFMGTVYGIGLAVSQLGEGSLDDPNLLTQMAGSLGIAFNTTLLALVLSVILQFFTQHYEAEEENLINSFGKHILDNLINKLVERK